MSLLDTRGHRCPIPVVRTETALRALAPGETLTVLADDPVAGLDIPHFAREAGYAVEKLDDDRAPLVFRLSKPLETR